MLRPLCNPFSLEFQELRFDPAGDRSDDLVLQLEQIGKIAVVALGHDVMAGIGLDQLRRNTHPAA